MSSYSLVLEGFDQESAECRQKLTEILEVGFDLDTDQIQAILNQGQGTLAEASSKAELEARHKKLIQEGAKVTIVAKEDLNQNSTDSLSSIQNLGEVDFDKNDSLYGKVFTEETTEEKLSNTVSPTLSVEPLSFDFDEGPTEPPAEPIEVPNKLDYVEPKSDSDFDLEISFDDTFEELKDSPLQASEDFDDSDSMSIAPAPEVQDLTGDMGLNDITDDLDLDLTLDLTAVTDSDTEVVEVKVKVDVEQEKSTAVVEQPEVVATEQPTPDLGVAEEQKTEHRQATEPALEVETAEEDEAAISLETEANIEEESVSVTSEEVVSEPVVKQQDLPKEQAAPATTEAHTETAVVPAVQSTSTTNKRRKKRKRANHKLALIALGAVILAGAAYFSLGGGSEVDQKIALEEEQQAKRVAAKKKAKLERLEKERAAAKAEAARELEDEYLIDGPVGELTIVGKLHFVRARLTDLQFTITAPKPRDLTPEELVEDKIPAPWLRRIAIASLGIVQSPDGNFNAAGKARIYVEDNGERNRTLESVGIKGQYKKGADTLDVQIKLGSKPYGAEGVYSLERVAEASYKGWLELNLSLKLADAQSVVDEVVSDLQSEDLVDGQ